MTKPAVRYLIVALLFLAAVLNYVDKNTFALLAPTIQHDLGLSDQAYANIQNAFQVTYTVASLASGAIVDRLGPGTALALFVGWWSIANMLTGVARSSLSLAGCRSLLGLGEAGNWTASPKAVAECFPANERGLAIGIYTAGTPLGMTLAPLFIIWLGAEFGWRATFVATGLLGLLWLIPWVVSYRIAEKYASVIKQAKGWTWLQAFSRPEVWCLMIGRMLSDPIWYFYQNWFPKYLVSARGFSQAQVKSVWVIFLAAGLGCLAGGWLAGWFIKRGVAPEQARLWLMLGCALFMPLSPLVALVSSVQWSLGIASLIIFMHLAWLTNITALVVDVVPGASLGTVFGIVAAGSSIGAIGMNSFVAVLLKHYSYANWFWIAGWLHLAVIPILMWGIFRRKRFDLPTAA